LLSKKYMDIHRVSSVAKLGMSAMNGSFLSLLLQLLLLSSSFSNS
jgi:hypothetical protein